MSANIANAFTSIASQVPRQDAIISTTWADNCWGCTPCVTYAELKEQSLRIAGGLAQLGVQENSKVLVLLKPGLDFYRTIWALFMVGAVPVLLDPGMGRKALLSSIEHIAPDVLLGIPRALFAKYCFPRAFKSIRLTIGAGLPTFPGIPCLKKLQQHEPLQKISEKQNNDLAAILFTSGSTGPPKGVAYTHGMFQTQLQWIQQEYGLKAGEIDLPAFPLFGLFSSAMGLTVVIPDMNPSLPANANPDIIYRTLEKYQVTTSFGSPAFWKTVSQGMLAHARKLTTLKRILMAGAPVSGELLQQVHDVLPENALIHTPYGATESLPVASIHSTDVLNETWSKTCQGIGTCVGKPLPGVQVKIIAITDAPLETLDPQSILAPGQKGEIIVQSPATSQTYVQLPEASKAAKIKEGTQFWHRMGDIGYLDEAGRLWFCGRKNHRVALPDKTLFSVCCEALFNVRPDVARSALVGVQGKPVIIIELNPGFDGSSLRQEVLKHAARHPLTADIRTVLFHPDFPVDVRHNIKINRELLARWAEDQLA